MNGISATAVAQCTPRVQPPTCPVNCVGAWGACSAACGGGTQTYAVITPPSNGGAACTNNTGDLQVCNSQACAVPVDCAGSWSACDQITGTMSYTITQAPQNGGVACPSPLTQTCPVNCVGSWGACGGPPLAKFKTYTWTTPPLNGGSSATCAYPNGQTDSASCAPTTVWALVPLPIHGNGRTLTYANCDVLAADRAALFVASGLTHPLGPSWGPGPGFVNAPLTGFPCSVPVGTMCESLYCGINCGQRGLWNDWIFVCQ